MVNQRIARFRPVNAQGHCRRLRIVAGIIVAIIAVAPLSPVVLYWSGSSLPIVL